MDNGDRFMKTGEAAEILCISVQTLRQYEAYGCLIPRQRYPSGHRKYTRKQIEDFLAGIGDEGGMERTRADYMSGKEVCRYCGFSISLLHSLDERGILKPRRRYPVSNKRLYLKADVEKFYKSTTRYNDQARRTFPSL